MARASRIALDMALATSKALRSALGTAWQYAKTEVVPPIASNYFNGPVGKALENTAAKSVDGFIGGLENTVRQMDAEEERKRQAKEAAIKAAHDKAIAEAKRKEEEKKKEIAEKLAAEAKAKAKEEKKAEPPKSEKPNEKQKPAEKTKKDKEASRKEDKA